MFAPKNGWLEYDPFLLGPGLFARAIAVSFRDGCGSGLRLRMFHAWSLWALRNHSEEFGIEAALK